ncbi:MAG: AAA family ATPase [Methanobrevibacter sp.]|nr:AAA family ATPase [Methanobrevibacter sp.]
MVYKTFRVNSNNISIKKRYNLPKGDLKDLIPFSNFEGHYGGKVDGIEDTIGVFLTPFIYFPSSCESQLSNFKDITGFVDLKIKKSDIESYFNQVSNLEDIFETDLTVGTYVENRNWLLQEDKCEFLGISDDRIDIEVFINDTPVNVYFKTDVNIRIFKKDDVMIHLRELTKNPNQLIHLEMDRNDFKVKDKFGDLMSDSNLAWTDFYTEFADKLLEYKENRTQLIQKIQKVYEKININLPTLDRDANGKKIIPYDIDPFTIFALFNKGITDDNRIKIINGIKEEFYIKSDVPIDFFGIPVVNNLGATFYYFNGSRGEDDIDNLWNVFSCAINYSKDFNERARVELINYFDKVIEQKGIKWNITMGLFWICPSVFVSLDNKNKGFLSNPHNLSQKVANEINSLKTYPPKGDTYLRICDYVYESIKESEDFDSLIELSHCAYIFDNNEEDSSKKGIGDDDVRSIHYWIYSPGSSADMWDEFYDKGIMAIHYTTEIGDLIKYSNKEDLREELQEIYQDDSPHVNVANALWQFANDIEIGDIIFAKKGMNEIIGRGIVESDYYFNEDANFPHIRNVKWTHKGTWHYGDENNKLNRKTLTDISHLNEKVNVIKSFFEDEEDYEEPRVIYPIYTSEDFLEEVYVTEEDYETLVKLVLNKKNLILQGAPGVGKTFMAKRLAYSIMGEKDIDRVMMVQFHQSYSYEDFVMGYRPSKDGFELREGSFYKFCKKAEDDDENDYFFIIDEINRGNLSKIFGELFMLIENDKRGEKNKIQLLYSDELFYIPKNVHIIGLMNTADRSLAMIDYALRRRFAFFDLKPGFSSEGFKEYQSNIDYSVFDDLIDIMEELNEEIKKDETLGEGFRIGHSYFCNLNPDEIEEKLAYIIEYEIIPLLKEYWFDEPDKVENWSQKLRDCLNE